MNRQELAAFVESKAVKARKDHLWRVDDAAMWRKMTDADERAGRELNKAMGHSGPRTSKAERIRNAECSERIGDTNRIEAEAYEAIAIILRQRAAAEEGDQ